MSRLPRQFGPLLLAALWAVGGALVAVALALASGNWRIGAGVFCAALVGAIACLLNRPV